MLKRLTRKLVTLSVLVAAITALSSTPGPSANGGPYCLREPVTAECPSGIWCCPSDLSGECWCG
jgi:hypothetical protein